jgi:hypothetical protein
VREKDVLQTAYNANSIQVAFCMLKNSKKQLFTLNRISCAMAAASFLKFVPNTNKNAALCQPLFIVAAGFAGLLGFYTLSYMALRVYEG